MRRAIAIIETLDREFPLSSTLDKETRGSTFTPSLVRGFYIVLGHAMLKVCTIIGRLTTREERSRKINPHSRWKRSRLLLRKSSKVWQTILSVSRLRLPYPESPTQWSLELCTACISTNAILEHITTREHICCKNVYNRTDDRLGYYHKFKSMEEDHDGDEYKEHLEQSIDRYLRAASLFPDDEPEKQVLQKRYLITECNLVCRPKSHRTWGRHRQPTS
jgi:hypothetical protein